MILDISTQNMFTSIQQLGLTGSLTAMIFDPQSNILYAGGKIEKNIGFISTIEITPERQMKVIQSIDMPEFPLSLGLAEGSLFSGAEGYQGGLYLILIFIINVCIIKLPIILLSGNHPVNPSPLLLPRAN